MQWVKSPLPSLGGCVTQTRLQKNNYFRILPALVLNSFLWPDVILFSTSVIFLLPEGVFFFTLAFPVLEWQYFHRLCYYRRQNCWLKHSRSKLNFCEQSREKLNYRAFKLLFSGISNDFLLKCHWSNNWVTFVKLWLSSVLICPHFLR